MKVALCHDYLLVMRGAERVFKKIADSWPEAPIFTSVYSEEGTEGEFSGRDIRPTRLQALGVDQSNFRRLLPLYPRAFRGLDLEGFDLVISSSSAFAHGLSLPVDSTHLCYCHSPFRYAWHAREAALAEVPRALRMPVNVSLNRIQSWDRRAAAKVDRYVANSELTKGRIRQSYGRDAAVVYPPVDVDRFKCGVPEDWVLCVSEIVSHKRIELALQAARIAQLQLKIVGDGPERQALEAAYPEAEFLGRVDDAVLAELYARAKSVLVPSVEEFGIVAVEGQASGRPVVAPAEGGAAETVVDGETGLLVSGSDPAEFAAALRSPEIELMDARVIMRNAGRFNPERFTAELEAEAERALGGAVGGI